jgi:hypothetical protein
MFKLRLELSKPIASVNPTVDAHVTAPPSLRSPEAPKPMFFFTPIGLPVTF